ncbi:MAG: single-stranded-DNA-specific exonuclease RecJ [Desulfobulbaceae bacterium]|nr:single-stranded-DNA-specific exonuclease RecJ [Desulfobulbaceae bacterium]
MDTTSFHYINSPPDNDLCQKLAQEMNIPYGVAVLLCRKGLGDKKEASAFLYPRLADLPSPFLMKDMDRAVDLVLQTYKQQGLILIHGDYDVDGISGTALLSLFFTSLGITTICFQPNRLTEGYGLQKSIIEQHCPANNTAALLITVDCGISAHDEVFFARESGYNVIITDHHLPPATLPEAEAILNPKQQECLFPYEDLAGVGVAFFLAMGIRNRMVEQGLINKNNAPKLKDLLSLVALGTVADVMPLTDINRILVKAGLEVISKRSVPWTWALCERAGLKEGAVTAENISFRLAPRINAPGRLGEPESAFRLLTSSDTVNAIELADNLETINQERRQLELDTIEKVLRECTLQDNKGYRGLVVYGNYHPGIIGVIASRIVDKFHKPAIIFTDDTTGSDILKGSGRSIEQINLYETLKECSDTLIQFGGHAMAAGLTIKKEVLPQFIEEFNLAVPETGDSPDKLQARVVNLDYNGDKWEIFDSRFFHYYQLMEPFGNGNPEPVFLLTNQEMSRVSVVAAHLKYSVNVNGKTFRGIGFGMADKLNMVQNNPVDLLFKLRKNVYRGEEYIEFHAVDIVAAE